MKKHMYNCTCVLGPGVQEQVRGIKMGCWGVETHVWGLKHMSGGCMRGWDGCRWLKWVAEGLRHVSGVWNTCLGVVGGRNRLLRPEGLRCMSEGCRWLKQVTKGSRCMSNVWNTCLGVVGGWNGLLRGQDVCLRVVGGQNGLLKGWDTCMGFETHVWGL